MVLNLMTEAERSLLLALAKRAVEEEENSAAQVGCQSDLAAAISQLIEQVQSQTA
jgi:hypothetical protein